MRMAMTGDLLERRMMRRLLARGLVRGPMLT